MEDEYTAHLDKIVELLADLLKEIKAMRKEIQALPGEIERG
jgi:hypothetical protein